MVNKTGVIGTEVRIPEGGIASGQAVKRRKARCVDEVRASAPSRLEAVAHAGLGEQVARACGIGLQLAAQLCHVLPQVLRLGLRTSGPQTSCSSWRWLTSLPGLRARTSSRCHSVGVRCTGSTGRRCGSGGRPGRRCSGRSALPVQAPAPASAAGDRPDAGQEFVDAERFGDVVVGAGVERVDLVAAVRPAGQHDDRDGCPGAQLADDLDAVDVGQAEVEHDQVGVRRAAAECSASAPSAAVITS